MGPAMAVEGVAGKGDVGTGYVDVFLASMVRLTPFSELASKPEHGVCWSFYFIGSLFAVPLGI